MNIDFEDRVVLVSGAAHGFGRAIAEAFVQRDAYVFICDINAEGLAETAKICGKNCEALTLNVGDRDAVQAAIAKIEASGKTVDILVNNAGGVCGQTGRPIEEISEADWQNILNVNLSGAFFLTQAVAPAMKAKRFGRVINISSRAGLEISLTGIQAYASAKAGQIGLTRQLAHELGEWNITVNNVAPGFIRSNPSTEIQWAAMGETGQKNLINNIALKRLGVPEDIAHAVLFFASEQANWVTGQVLSVDGGK